MKLLRLALTNINSIRNAEIDFTEFENSLFLISGPTGSGKSTIIDAVCAALYNKTPRLKKSAGELLTHNSKKGKIELDFFIGNIKYNVVWEAKRVKSGINVTHKLKVNNDSDFIDKHVPKKIEQILKLDFGQFTKAIVLAQGEFDAFLNANSTQKAEILKNILDLEEYEEISRRIYERTEEMKNIIENIKLQIPDVDEKKLEAEISKKENLIIEYKKLNERFEVLKELKEKEKLKTEIEKLKRSLISVEKEINKKKFELKEKKELLDEISIKKEEYDKKYKQISLKITEAEKIKENINVLDSSINSFNKLINTKQNELKRVEEEIFKNQNELKNINVEEKKEFTVFEKIKEEFDRRKFLNSQLDELKKKLFENDTTIQNLKKEYYDNLKKISNISEIIINPLVIELEVYRKELKDGEPCPLCGSLEHPYKKNPPKIQKELLYEYQTLQEKVKELEKQLNTLSIKKETFLKDKKSYENQIKNIDLTKYGIYDENDFYNLQALKTEYEKNKKEFDLLKNKISNLLLKKEDNLRDIENYKKELMRSVNKKQKLQDIYRRLLSELNINEKELDELKTFLHDEESKIKKEYEKAFKEYNRTNTDLSILKNKSEILNSDLSDKKSKYSQITIEGEYNEEEEKEIRKNIETLNRMLGETEERIKNLKTMIDKKNELKNEIKILNEKLRVYEKINRKIGSKNGKKFSKIILRYFLDSLLHIANTHLKSLSDDRYLLEVVSDGDDFDLKIIDRFFENERRNVKTLSGGEKFLVSLSLAFALSDFMKNKINIESMFLDEGFGTLDREYLNKALEILKKASIGKTIGIISHVESLKEEIEKQIIVKKLNSGISVLEINKG